MPDAARTPRTGLPASSDLFVGRDDELAALAQLLAAPGAPGARVVTLTGPPRIGKTRLAVACASAYAERNGGGAGYVDLVPVQDPALFIPALPQPLAVHPPLPPALTA